MFTRNSLASIGVGRATLKGVGGEGTCATEKPVAWLLVLRDSAKIAVCSLNT